MTVKISVVCPVKNEFPWIGYSIMAALPFVHEFLYALSPSDDGTEELLKHLSAKYPQIQVIPYPDFNVHDMAAYNEAFNVGIRSMTGDAAWFLHPDMIVTQGAEIKEGPLAWYTNVTSFAGDLTTRITKGRAGKWKNIHAKKFGLHYFGGYGSQNEDFYHSDITGKSYKHYGEEFSKYPYQVANAGIEVSHYCEVKNYKRRYEKMRLCLKTQYPNFADDVISELASRHPRVTLAPSSSQFGQFAFEKDDRPIPEVIQKYKAEFEAFKRSPVCA